MGRIEQECLRIYGWYGHHDEGGYHTHGVALSFDHPDLQISGLKDPKWLHMVAAYLIARISTGARFEAGVQKTLTILTKSFNVAFSEGQEDGRAVLNVRIA